MDAEDRRVTYKLVISLNDKLKRDPNLADLAKASPYTKGFMRRIVKAMTRAGELHYARDNDESSGLILGSEPK